MTRPTRTISIDPDEPDLNTLTEAARILQAGGLVAFATETVYGLGAEATNARAVARIFEAKGRPATNPLIVHADGVAMALSCAAIWPETAQTLADRFWPGPLTLVLPRASTIPDIVTSGRETVGIRQPATAVARGLITRAGSPLAAPSANRSTGLSPTLARHVQVDLDGRIDLILDSGQTTVGLESTVVDLTTREPRILRPGPIAAEELEHALGGLRVRDALDEPVPPGKPSASPGQMAVHYAPRTRAVRVATTAALSSFRWPRRTRAALIVVGPHDPPPVPVPIAMQFDLATPGVAARDLYVVLHQCDRMRLDLIVVVPPPDRPEWRAVRDRLKRATEPA